jgi:hypothetical protein
MLFGAVAASGCQLKLLVITHHDTVETELSEGRFAPDRMYYRSQDNTPMTSEFFTQCSSPLFQYFDET